MKFSRAVVHHRSTFFDFESMYMWSDFDLRMNHANIQRNPHPDYKPSYRKPNMLHLSFWEIRYIRGQLKTWLADSRLWVPVYLHNETLNKEITKMYEDYIFETKVLT